MPTSGPKEGEQLQRLGIGRAIPSPKSLFRWVYFWRVALASVVFVAAAFYFRSQPAATILALAVAAIRSVVVTALSLWHTHVRGVVPGPTFRYTQALFDLALVTTIVHLTGGADSDFSALYIPVITVSAVLMPVGSSLLVTVLASLLYFSDIVWWHPVQLSVAVGLQIGVFIFVAIASGWLASRVRAVGAEHQVLQQEVRRLRLEASDILRNIPSGVISVDGEGTLLFVNPAAESLLGVPATDWVNQPILHLLRERSPELWGAIRATSQTGQPVVRAEGRVTLGERSFPIGLATTAVATPEDAPASVTAIFTDISDQKRLEQLHLRTERLEAVAELSTSLAHEIRNPLASIRSSVEQLARAARGNEDERFLTQLVVRESDRLSRLLSEFLDFSRVRVTRRRPVDLGLVAQAAVDLIRKHPDCQPGAEIAVHRAPAHMEGDEDLLHRVVQNLVLNAVQAAGAGARVGVEVREAVASELPRGVAIEGPVLLRVRDNGPGIPEELRHRLFLPFVTGRIGGTGLGLAIVQRAVQAHRGLVLLDTEPGKGTTFTVLFPAKAAAEAAA
ncbi:MAG: PAS domain-containing protein [Gemmatimonadetes bacterium]|nr:PAS domain-containing protein [Gemmatimonadota bacterium]